MVSTEEIRAAMEFATNRNWMDIEIEAKDAEDVFDTLAAAVLFIVALFWRWLALDALLNLLRELPLFYAGQSGRSTTDSFLAQFPIPGRAILKIAPLAIVLFLYISLKYLTP